MNPDIQQMQSQILELQKRLDALENTQSIPINVDKSFVGRGFLKSSQAPFFVIGADAGSWLRMVASVDGGAGGTVDVPAYPQWFLEFTEGPLAGLLLPLYVKPKSYE